MRILLHICCAPCAIYPVNYLRQKELEIYGYSYNPNIHPYTEWKKRKNTLVQYAGEIGLELIGEGAHSKDAYSMEEFLRAVVFRENTRCRFCYQMRLQKTAEVARENGFDGFTTTLLVSPFQKHSLIKEIGEAVAEESGIPFYYYDFRPGFKEATARAKELGLYRQPYCGCIYSEKERYYPKSKR